MESDFLNHAFCEDGVVDYIFACQSLSMNSLMNNCVNEIGVKPMVEKGCFLSDDLGIDEYTIE